MLEFNPLNHDYTIELEEVTHTYRVNGKVEPGYHEICDCVGTRRRCDECSGTGSIGDAQCDQCNGTGYTLYRAISGSEFMKNEKAARFGYYMHKFIEYDMRGQRGTYKDKFEVMSKKEKQKYGFIYDSELEPYIAGYRKFLKEHRIETHLVEERFFHKFYGYCITIDWFGFLHIKKPRTKIPCIIDWKTSTTVQKAWSRQTAAQEEAVKYNLKLNYRKIHRLAVQLKPNDYEPVEHKGSDFNKFLSILNIYKGYRK